MPPRRRATPPPPIDIEAVRRKLADGKIVRVGISRSAQFPDGGTGRVRRVGDPQTDGEEYVQVELSLNGMKDVLPFTPADLTPAARGRPPGSGRQVPPPDSSSPARVVPSTKGPPIRPAALGAPPDAAATQGAATQGAATQGAATQGAATQGGSTQGGSTQRGSTRRQSTPSAFAVQSSVRQAPPRHSRAASATSESGQQSSTSEIPSPHAASASASASKTKSPRSARRPAAVSVTVATSPSESTQWRIEARVGNKVAVKSAAVSPARVWELVQSLQNEELSEAVGAILEEHRSVAQARADTLASELAAVRAELQALPDARQQP